MAKSNKDHALQLLEMALKDHKALENMLEPDVFVDEIFGFHAQQTIEKALKAWISVLGLTYPKTHDVSYLIRMLEDAGEDLSLFPDLEDYSIFAVQYRYEAYDESEEELDRDTTINVTKAFIDHIRRIIELKDRLG
jgi:HEPN domain-containing protein